MKRLFLIMLATLATAFLGLNDLTFAEDGPAYVSVPGNSLVQDGEYDFLLVHCNEALPDAPCSLPPDATLPPPGWMDIKKAKITQIGNERVNLSITLREPVPETMTMPLFHYLWTFQDVCIEPSPTDKYAIAVWWNGNTGMWRGAWVVVTSCNPRAFYIGDPVDFLFTEDGVKVQVPLHDLITLSGPSLKWYAYTRILHWTHPLFNSVQPIDIAPNVWEFDYSTSPPSIIKLEDPAEWEMR